jgi:hypothetical protein
MERDHSEALGVDGIVLKFAGKKCNGEAWTGSIWLWIGPGGRHL